RGNPMRKIVTSLGLTALALLALPAQAQLFEEGSTVVMLANMHHQAGETELYSLNYQLPAMIPMCTEATVVKRKKKQITLAINGVEFKMKYDKHTKKAGVSFDDALGNYFGESCETDKAEALSEVDRKGIRDGLPYEGMSKQGILYAMGRPPQHATPSLDGNMWMYWLNRFKRQAIHFDENGNVERIRL
ncbi:MAG: hypothetical protein AAFN78_07055, partial [Pseudomonadota bacterium]